MMKRYEIKIKGWRDNLLVWNRMKKEIQDKLKNCKSNELAEWEEKNWILKAEVDGNKNLVLPSEWIISSLINSAKQTRLNPHFATSKKETFTRYIQGQQIPQKTPIILGKIKDVEKIQGYYENPNTHGRIWKIFPAIKNWSATFTLYDPFGRMYTKELEELLKYAGELIGLGDQRNRGYGRFDIESIKEIE